MSSAGATTPRRHGTDEFVTVIIDLTPVHDRNGPAGLLDARRWTINDRAGQRAECSNHRIRSDGQVVAMDGSAGCKPQQPT